MEDVVLDSGIRDLGRERGKGWGGAERRVEVAKKGRGHWRRSGNSGSLTSSSRASGAAAGGGGGGGDVAYAGGGGGDVAYAGGGGGDVAYAGGGGGDVAYAGGGGGDVAYAGGGGGFVSTAGAGGAGVGNAVYRARTLSFYAAPPTPASGAASGTASGAASGVASAPGAASGAAGAGVAPRSPLQQGYRGGYGQHRQQTQRGMAQQGLAQQGMGVAQQGMAQQGMEQQGMAQQGMAQVQGSGGVSHVWRPEGHIPRVHTPAAATAAAPVSRAAAGAAAARAAGPRGKREASREKDRNMVAFLLNMLTSLQPSPPSATPAPPFTSPMPSAPAFAHPLPASNPAFSSLPPSHPAVSPTHLGDVQGVKPDVYVYSTLFGLLGRGRDAANLARVVEEMREDGCEHNAVTLQSLATAYGRAGRWEEALATLGAMQGGGTLLRLPSSLTSPLVSTLQLPHLSPHPQVDGRALFRMGGYHNAIKAFTDLHVNTPRVDALFRMGRYVDATKHSLICAAPGTSQIPSYTTQCSPATAACLTPHFSPLPSCLPSLRSPRVSPLSAPLVSPLSPLPSCLPSLRSPRVSPLSAPLVSPLSPLPSCLPSLRSPRVSPLSAPLVSPLSPLPSCLPSLRSPRVSPLSAPLVSPLSPLPSCLPSLRSPRVDALFRMGRYSDAIKAFTDLRNAGHVPDSFVYNTVLTCYGRVGNSAGAEEAFKDMIRHGVALDVRCANSLMDAYGRTGRVDDAMAVFDRMCLAAVAAGGASHMKGGGGGGLARERGGNRSNAHLPGAAAVAGIPPLNPHIAADNASTLHGSAARPVCTSAAAEAVTVAPAPLSTTATTGTVTSIPFSRAFAWPAPDQITYSCAIHLLSIAGRLSEAEETFEAMLVAGMRPDTITWSTMVQMWAKEANPERAAMWFKRMVAAGCRPETPAYNSLMWAFVGRGMFDEAGEVLGALKHGWDLVGQAEKLVGRGENLMGRGEEEQEATQGGSGKLVFGWLNSSAEGESGPGGANKGAAGAVSPQSKPGVAKLELAPNLMTYTMFLSECTESAARSDVARLLRLMEETEHAAHTVFQLLTEEPFESTHTLLPAGAESDSESAPLSGAVCEAGSAAGCEPGDWETRRCEGESEGASCEEVGWGAVCGMIESGLVEVEVRGVVGEWEEERWREVERRMRGSAFSESSAESQRAFADACIAFLHKFGRHEQAARMWDLCHTRLRLYPCSIQLPAISGQVGECFVDLHGMSAGTAVTVTKWALEKMRQAVVASAAAGASATPSAVASPTASSENGVGAISEVEATTESLSGSGSGAADSSSVSESLPAPPLRWKQPLKVAVVTGWGKRSRVQGASLVKAAVEALLLRDLTAPFSLHRFHPGSYEAPGADLEHWLLTPGVEQLLAP
ncbi:unnamed protein product [Closterium sp. Naga37s-1]|nr:unnamed protein product [Closterium sp. Naga37s-1]